MNTKPVLVCFAVPEESKYFRAPAGLQTPVQVLVTGMGAKNASSQARALLDRQPMGLVLTCGFAGALRTGLAIGTVVYDQDAGLGVGEILGPLSGQPVKFHCCSRIVTTAAEKRALGVKTGADVVEMESGIIRELCHEKGIPSATVRVISDTVDQDLPLDFNALLTDQMELSFAKLAWALVRSPGRIGGLLQLQRHTQRAAHILGEALQELLRRGGSLGA